MQLLSLKKKRVAVPLALGLMAAVAVVVSSALGSHARPRIATPMRYALVPAFQQCGTTTNVPNATHQGPLNFPSCDPPLPESSAVRYGHDVTATPSDRGAGFVTFQDVPDNPSTTTDESDLKITSTIFDVTQPDGVTDYDPSATHDLTLNATYRITDHRNTFTSQTCSPNCTGTQADSEFPVNINCTPTSFQGSTCTPVATSFNAVVPGTWVNGARANIEVGQIHVDDLAGKAFLRGGIFVP